MKGKNIKLSDKTTHALGAIVFLDALGTKMSWTNKEPKKYIDTFENILKSFKSGKKEYDGVAEEFQNDPESNFLKLEIRSFSDTVIMFLYEQFDRVKDKYDRLYGLYQLASLGIILSESFYKAIKKGIYFRGVIGFGEYHFSKNMIIGPAVEEAAEWFERPDWIGISTTPSATYGLQLLKERGKFPPEYMPYDVPMKDGKNIDSFALLWPLQNLSWNKKVNPKEADKMLKKVRKKVLESFSLEKSIGISSESKYNNTLRFIDCVKARYGSDNKSKNC